MTVDGLVMENQAFQLENQTLNVNWKKEED